MSLFAIRFTETAREQIDIAREFDSRVRAQLVGYSAINEVIFHVLSESIEIVDLPQERGFELPSDIDVNMYGQSIPWGKGVVVSIQDLNGLLPQLFPSNSLWKRLLSAYGHDDAKIEQYLGLWRDIQDGYKESWKVGDKEPDLLPAGQRYFDGFAQTHNVLSWVFGDHPELLRDIRRFSNLDSLYETNLLNSPPELLEIIFDGQVAAAIADIRSRGGAIEEQLKALLPADVDFERLQFGNSGRLKIRAFVEMAGGTWTEKITIRLMASDRPPYQVWLNN